MERGTIVKTKSQDNEKDVLFHATPKGRRAIESHRKFEEAAFVSLREIETRLAPAEFAVIDSFLSKLSVELEKIMKRAP
jgi:DNA-binding MarR family transcriptional regulator